MSDDRVLWLVGETDYEWFTPHCVFESEDDAKAYSEIIKDGVHELPVFAAGTMPEIVEAWTCTAIIRTRVRTAIVSIAGRSTYKVYDNEPPKLESERFSVLGSVPLWARQPCEVALCGMDGSDDLAIRFHGYDREAVLEACRQRYEAGLDAMGARR